MASYLIGVRLFSSVKFLHRFPVDTAIFFRE